MEKTPSQSVPILSNYYDVTPQLSNYYNDNYSQNQDFSQSLGQNVIQNGSNQIFNGPSASSINLNSGVEIPNLEGGFQLKSDISSYYGEVPRSLEFKLTIFK